STLLFFYLSGPHRARHSFPTRRSSDLVWAQIGGDYFRAMGIPLLKGRYFHSLDGPGSPPVAIVNQTLAKRYWPGEDPIGKRLKRSEEHTSELQSRFDLVCRLLLEKKTQ